MMGRREFITLLGGAAVVWPLAAHAQQLPVIGYLSSLTPSVSVRVLAGFRQGLTETGYIEHRSVGIEYRWAEGQYDRLPALTADLINHGVAVIFAMTRVRAASKSIPSQTVSVRPD